MDLPALITSDLHLTAQPKDAYRWKLFPWLQDECVSGQVKSLVILGDITDAKDYHPSELVLKLFAEIKALATLVKNVYILLGNHDYLREGSPTFAALEAIPGVHFITSRHETFGDTSVLWLPHTRTPSRDWADVDASHFNYVFMHQTVSGSIASNGQKMEGEALPDFAGWGKIYSGDIHVPQKIGAVEYVGSPYHVHFGDRFKPRCIYLTRRGAEDVAFESTQRWVLRCSSLQELRRLIRTTEEGDQIRVAYTLPAAEKHQWASIRQEVSLIAKQAGVELHGTSLQIDTQRQRVRINNAAARGLTSAEIVSQFVEAEGWGPDALDIGLDLL